MDGSDFRGEGPRCLRFYFSMNGHHTGSLRVFAQNSGRGERYLWTLTGDQKQGWHPAAVNVDGNGLTQVS